MSGRGSAAAWVRAGVVASLALLAAAAWCYPGGAPGQPSRAGYSFWDNYLCDLFRSVAINGAENDIGQALATAGALCVVLSIWGGFALAAQRLPWSRRSQRVVVALGSVACLAMLAVPLTPADRVGRLHFVVVGLAALPSWATLGLLTLGLTRSGARTTRLERGLTRLAFALSTLHFAHYVAELVGGPRYGVGVAAIQKVVTGVDLVWVSYIVAPPLTSRGGRSL